MPCRTLDGDTYRSHRTGRPPSEQARESAPSPLELVEVTQFDVEDLEQGMLLRLRVPVDDVVDLLAVGRARPIETEHVRRAR